MRRLAMCAVAVLVFAGCGGGGGGGGDQGFSLADLEGKVYVYQDGGVIANVTVTTAGRTFGIVLQSNGLTLVYGGSPRDGLDGTRFIITTVGTDLDGNGRVDSDEIVPLTGSGNISDDGGQLDFTTTLDGSTIVFSGPLIRVND